MGRHQNKNISVQGKHADISFQNCVSYLWCGDKAWLRLSSQTTFKKNSCPVSLERRSPGSGGFSLTSNHRWVNNPDTHTQNHPPPPIVALIQFAPASCRCQRALKRAQRRSWRSCRGGAISWMQRSLSWRPSEFNCVCDVKVDGANIAAAID